MLQSEKALLAKRLLNSMWNGRLTLLAAFDFQLRQRVRQRCADHH